jgi:hypothetical protein
MTAENIEKGTPKKSSPMKFRILFSLYVTFVYYILFVLKIFNRDKITDILYAAGYGLEMREGPLRLFRWLMYLMGIGLFIIMLLLPKIMKIMKREGVLNRCLIIAFLFWAFSILAWLSTKIDYPFIGFYIVFGGFFGIVEAVQSLPLMPFNLNDKRFPLEAKCELLKLEDAKWWRGLTLIWGVIIAAGISGFLSWVLASYPSIEDVRKIPDLGKIPELTFTQGMVLLSSIVPAIGILVWNIIWRTNNLYKKLQRLYKIKSEINSDIG